MNPPTCSICGAPFLGVQPTCPCRAEVMKTLAAFRALAEEMTANLKRPAEEPYREDWEPSQDEP